MRISRPGIDRHLEDFLLNVDKPRFFVPALQAAGDAERPVGLHGGVVDQLHPFLEGPVIGHGAVVAVWRRHDLLALHVPAGFQIVEGFPDDVFEVDEGAGQDAGVDIVEIGRRQHPIIFAGVVDVEMYVFRD